MIVKLRIEITDEQRRILSGTKKLASREQVTEYVEGCVAAISQFDIQPGPPEPVKKVAGKVPIAELMDRAEREFKKELKGKSDSFIRGYAKVAYYGMY